MPGTLRRLALHDTGECGLAQTLAPQMITHAIADARRKQPAKGYSFGRERSESQGEAVDVGFLPAELSGRLLAYKRLCMTVYQPNQDNDAITIKK